jgi:hypothetical protein
MQTHNDYVITFEIGRQGLTNPLMRTEAVDRAPPTQRSGAAGTRPRCSWCKKMAHTYEQCWTRVPALRPPHLQVKSVGNAHGHGNRQDGLRTNNGHPRTSPEAMSMHDTTLTAPKTTATMTK